MLGSEGTLGVVTEAWMRLQERPRYRANASVRFTDYKQGVQCVRALAQSGLYPSNCRLLDPMETVFSGVGDGSAAVMVLGFESADHPMNEWMKEPWKWSAITVAAMTPNRLSARCAMTEAKSTAAAQPARGDRPSCACLLA